MSEKCPNNYILARKQNLYEMQINKLFQQSLRAKTARKKKLFNALNVLFVFISSLLYSTDQHAKQREYLWMAF